MTKSRVVIRFDEGGGFAVYADDGVEVFTVCDFTPEDRVYRMSPEPVPEGMIGDGVGHKDDGSPASVRAQAALAKIEGRPHLAAVHAAQEGDNG